MDYGKYLYEQSRKTRQSLKKSHETETKSIRISISTSPHDLELKAKKASEFLEEGNRVKIEMILRGRAKYLDKQFIRERLERILHLITINHKVVDGPKQSPRGIGMIIEKVSPHTT